MREISGKRRKNGEKIHWTKIKEIDGMEYSKVANWRIVITGGIKLLQISRYRRVKKKQVKKIWEKYEETAFRFVKFEFKSTLLCITEMKAAFISKRGWMQPKKSHRKKEREKQVWESEGVWRNWEKRYRGRKIQTNGKSDERKNFNLTL